MKYPRLNRIGEAEEKDIDLSPEKISENHHPKLTLLHKIPHPENALLSLSSTTEDERGTLSKGSRDKLNSDPRVEVSSLLSIYFKTISKFPLLNEEEERSLAKRIKECEEECIHLAIQWKHLFNDEFLRIFSAKHKEEISKKLRLLNGSYRLFDDLTNLERERKKVDSALKRQINRFKIQEGFKEELCKVEAEISKCIAKINSSKAIIKGTMNNLEEIAPDTIDYTNKRQSVEGELRRILVKISELSKNIKELKSNLLHANLRMVISIAKKYAHHGLALLDLIQEGNLGLFRAIDTFDHRRGHRFIAYAIWWIRLYIFRALAHKSRTIRKPIHVNEQLNKIVKTSNRLLQEYKREPTLEEIAEETNISLEYIDNVSQSFKDPIAMDTLIEEGREHIITKALNHKRDFIQERAISSNLSQIINGILSELSPREREIVKLRFGIGMNHDHTLEEIGGKFHFSRERARQILERALSKMRTPKFITQLRDFTNSN